MKVYMLGKTLSKPFFRCIVLRDAPTMLKTVLIKRINKIGNNYIALLLKASDRGVKALFPIHLLPATVICVAAALTQLFGENRGF